MSIKAILFALYFFFDGFWILFFAENSFLLKLSVVNGVFFQSLSCAIIAFLGLYFLFPQINPSIGFLFIAILGIGTTALTIRVPFAPTLETVGVIKTIYWDEPSIIGFLQSIIFLITFIPLSASFLFQYQISKITFLRIRGLGMFLVILLGLNAGVINFFLKSFLKLNPLSGDIALGLFSLFLFLVLLYFSFQSESSKNNNLFKNVSK